MWSGGGSGTLFDETTSTTLLLDLPGCSTASASTLATCRVWAGVSLLEHPPQSWSRSAAAP